MTDHAPTFRVARAEDWPAILTLNNAEVPRVGALSPTDGDGFLRSADIVVLDGPDRTDLVALLVLMTDGLDYASPNYAWFSARYPRFGYVDRIVVRADHAGTGIGRALYDLAVAWSRSHDRPVLTAEVNVDPPNETSLAFHRRYGFTEVGRQTDPRNAHVVAMFALDLDQHPGATDRSPDRSRPVH